MAICKRPSFASLRQFFVAVIIQSLLCRENGISIYAESSSSSSSEPLSSASRESVEAVRYGSLPPTVFAPGGRLHGVERVTREAYPPGDDDLSCAVFALRCGGKAKKNLTGKTEEKKSEASETEDFNDEFGIMVGIGATSPFLHRDEAYLGPFHHDGQVHTEKSLSYMPLVLDGNNEPDDPYLSSAPIAVISPTILAGVGGKGIDSVVLLRRTIEVALSMFRSDNGGTDSFIESSIHGSNTFDSDRITHAGGASGIQVATLARRIADIAQSSTQSLGGKYGRMLSSSLVAIGVRESQARLGTQSKQLNDSHSESSNHDKDTVVLWRVDPTGQFWRLDASAVGRGATHIEAELLKRVRLWLEKYEQQEEGSSYEEEDALIPREISNEDVRSFLNTLSVDEALNVACDCLVDGILVSTESPALPREHDERRQQEKGLRKRIQIAVLKPNPLGESRQQIEVIYG